MESRALIKVAEVFVDAPNLREGIWVIGFEL